MPLKIVTALGASVANGYWDIPTFQGWFGRLAAKILTVNPPLDENGHVKRGALKFGFNNLSMDGDRICDSFHRLAGEGFTRKFDVLIIEVSGNDLIRRPNPDSPMDLSPAAREEYWHKLLNLVKICGGG